MLKKEIFKNYFKKFEFNKEISGIAGWFLFTSVFLTILLFVINIVALYDSPSRLQNFSANQNIFLGFYQVNTSTTNLKLSWCAYLTGVFTIILVLVDCFLYYMILVANLGPFVNLRLLMVNLISGVTTCTLLFVLNIFNKPIIDVHALNILVNGWNPDPSKLNSTLQFNYVYDISFITDGTKTLTSHKVLNNFNIIWILALTVCGLIYIISYFMFLNYKQVKISPILRKANYE